MVARVLGFLTGLFYTARPIALKYVALGEPSVFLMFGPLMVTGAYYVQRSEFAGQAVWVSIPVGILVALILLANNIRDIQFDGRVGIRTLATLLGKSSAVRFYELLVVGVYGVTALLVVLGQLSPWAFLTLLSLPLAFKLVKSFKNGRPEGCRCTDGSTQHSLRGSPDHRHFTGKACPMTSSPVPLRSILWTLPLAFGLWFLTFAVSAGNFWVKLCFSRDPPCGHSVGAEPGRVETPF